MGTCKLVLDGIEGFDGDDGGVGLILRPDPLAGVVPSHLGIVAQGDVIDVNEDLVAGLAVPDLISGVARVAEDGPNRRLGPGASTARAVTVASRIMCGGGEDPIGGESLGDGVQTPIGEELGEDPLHHRSPFRVGVEPPELLTGRCLGRIGVRAGVRQHISIGWPPAEESAFDGCLGGHRRADPGFDAVAFAFAHPAVEAHHQVVSI